MGTDLEDAVKGLELKSDIERLRYWATIQPKTPLMKVASSALNVLNALEQAQTTLEACQDALKETMGDAADLKDALEETQSKLHASEANAISFHESFGEAIEKSKKTERKIEILTIIAVSAMHDDGLLPLPADMREVLSMDNIYLALCDLSDVRRLVWEKLPLSNYEDVLGFVEKAEKAEEECKRLEHCFANQSMETIKTQQRLDKTEQELAEKKRLLSYLTKLQDEHDSELEDAERDTCYWKNEYNELVEELKVRTSLIE